MGGANWFRGTIVATAVAVSVATLIPAPAFAETDVSLQSAIDAAVVAQEGDYSVPVREIHGDPRLAEIDGDRRVEPASVIKLF